MDIDTDEKCGSLPAAASRRRSHPLTAAAMAVSAVLVAAGASAQSIDYGALQELFGEPVTTSFNGSPQRASEVAATMQILTQDDIRRSGARDLPGVLRHLASIDVLSWGLDNNDLSIRGLNEAASPRILLLIDGRQVYADFYGLAPWAALPVELAAIRQIEVVMGPNSALFGFNAVGGVVNIITYDPLRDDVDSLSLTAGTQDILRASLVNTLQLNERVAFRLSGGLQRSDDWSSEQRPVEMESRRGNERVNLGGRATIALSDQSELIVEATRTQSQQPDTLPTYFAVYEEFRSKSFESSYSLDSAWGLLQARYYINRFGTFSDTSVTGSPPIEYNSRLDVAQVQDLFKLGADHTLRLAVEYRSGEVGTTPVEGAEVYQHTLSGSAMWAWKIMPSLELTTAARHDRLDLGRRGTVPAGLPLGNDAWNRTIAEWSFNSGLLWQVDDRNVLRLSGARGIQLPSLANLGASLLRFPFGFAGGNPFLDPSTVKHLEGGWEHTFTPEFRLRLAVFHDDWRDLYISIGQSLGPGWAGNAANIGGASSHGAEAELAWTSGFWRAGLDYLYQSIDDELSAAAALVNYEDTHAKHTVTLRAGWQQGPWEVDGFARYKSRFAAIQGTVGPFGPLSTLVQVDDYMTVDGRVAYRLSDLLTLAVSGQNLLHDEQRQTSGAAVERNVLATVTLTF